MATPPTHASELQPQPACITTAYLSRNSFGWMFAPSTMRSPTLGRRKRKMLSKYSSLGAASGDQLSLQTPCQTRLNCLWAVHQEPSLRRNKLDQVEYSVEHILSRPPPTAHHRLTLGLLGHLDPQSGPSLLEKPPALPPRTGRVGVLPSQLLQALARDSEVRRWPPPLPPSSARELPHLPVSNRVFRDKRKRGALRML